MISNTPPRYRPDRETADVRTVGRFLTIRAAPSDFFALFAVASQSATPKYVHQLAGTCWNISPLIGRARPIPSLPRLAPVYSGLNLGRSIRTTSQV